MQVSELLSAGGNTLITYRMANGTGHSRSRNSGAGIPALPAKNQNSNANRPVSYINYDINEGHLSVVMHVKSVCKADVFVYSTSLFSKTTEKKLLSEELAPGERFFKFPKNALSGFATNVIVIYINNQAFYMKRI